MTNIYKNILFFIFALLQLIYSQKTTITITNQNLGLVKEERQIMLNKGRQLFNLQDIPEKIIPASVLIESEFNVLEQNFEYDLISVDKILQKSLEKLIVIEHPDQGKVEGKLLSADYSNIIIKTSDELVQVLPRNTEQKISLKEISADGQPFIIRPTLVWDVDAVKDGNHPVNISYLTNGLNWQADYVGLLNENDSGILLSGWVTIDNKSGKSFNETRLKLMAGEINIIQQEIQPTTDYATFSIKSGRAAFEEKPFYEYHLYDLQHSTTLHNNQIKQIRLIEETDAKIKKTYRVNSNAHDKVAVVVTIDNSQANNLGMPLPAGIIRLYKKDGGDREFIGENKINHTPGNEKIDIETGKAFDIVSERIINEIKRPSNKSERISVSYSIRNHKNEKVSIEIMEMFPLYREIQIHSAGGLLLEQKAGSIKYLLNVPAGKEEKLNLDYTLNW